MWGRVPATFAALFAAGLFAAVGFASDEDGVPTPPGPPGGTEQVAGTGSLTTLFASNNQFAGNTFDVENIGALPITISSFDVNCTTGSTTTFTIYWRTGTALGFESNSAGWTVMGVDSNVTCNGVNIPTPVAIGGFTINPGEVIGMYVDLTSYPSASLAYTNGGPTTFMNSEISVTTLHGKGNPAFTGANFFPRQWNGTIFYDIVPVELESFSAGE